MPDNHRGRKIIDLMQKRREKIAQFEAQLKAAREKQQREEVERIQKEIDAIYKKGGAMYDRHLDPNNPHVTVPHTDNPAGPRVLPQRPRIDRIAGPGAPLQKPHPPNVTEFPKKE